MTRIVKPISTFGYPKKVHDDIRSVGTQGEHRTLEEDALIAMKFGYESVSKGLWEASGNLELQEMVQLALAVQAEHRYLSLRSAREQSKVEAVYIVVDRILSDYANGMSMIESATSLVRITPPANWHEFGAEEIVEHRGSRRIINALQDHTLDGLPAWQRVETHSMSRARALDASLAQLIATSLEHLNLPNEPEVVTGELVKITTHDYVGLALINEADASSIRLTLLEGSSRYNVITRQRQTVFISAASPSRVINEVACELDISRR